MSYDKVVVDKRCTYYLLTWFYAEHQTKRFLDKIYEISWKTSDDDNVKNKKLPTRMLIHASEVVLCWCWVLGFLCLAVAAGHLLIHYSSE